MPVIADLEKGRDSLRPATVANMPVIAAVRVQINLDCCKYCPKCCRQSTMTVALSGIFVDEES